MSDEGWLEVGLVALALGVAAGIGVLMFGRASSASTQAQRHGDAPPSPHSVSSERHRNIQTVSAR